MSLYGRAEEGVTLSLEDLASGGGASPCQPPGWGVGHRSQLQQIGDPSIAACGSPTASKGVDLVSSQRTVPSTQPRCLPVSAVTIVHRGGCPVGGHCSSGMHPAAGCWLLWNWAVPGSNPSLLCVPRVTPFPFFTSVSSCKTRKVRQ